MTIMNWRCISYTELNGFIEKEMWLFRILQGTNSWADAVKYSSKLSCTDDKSSSMISKSDQCHNYILTMKNILVNICNTKSGHGSHCTKLWWLLSLKVAKLNQLFQLSPGKKKKKKKFV